jgi:hypothetical protein
LGRVEGEGEASTLECELGSVGDGADDAQVECGAMGGCGTCEAMWKGEEMAAGTVMAKYE